MSVATARPAFDSYLSDINVPLLSAQDERQLAARVAAGDVEARDRMVRANLRLVVNIARSYLGRGVPLEDLVSEGNMGLLRAVEGFDPSMNTRFSTYAAYWINQSIRRGIVNTAKTVRVPAYVAQLLGRWRRAANRMAEELGRAATPEEVAERMGLTRRQSAAVAEAMRAARAGQPASDDGRGLEELVADGQDGGPGAALMHAADVDRMRELFARLDPREAVVLRMRYGLGGADPVTLKEIGEHLGLTRERVRQIEAEAIEKLGQGFGR